MDVEDDTPLDPVPISSLDGADARVETHISELFFVGDFVYKRKKPVSMGFLDFTARDARDAACRREVELNRRLAPDVYLGTADLSDESGRAVDLVVVMRRMPDERRLATLVVDGHDVSDHLRGLARLVAAFHGSPTTEPTLPEAASADAVAETWEAGFDEMRRFVGPVLPASEVDRVTTLVRTYIAGRRPLFDHRIAEGWVRDGHGDLQADDIFCLDDGPRVLDCVEFDDRLRHGDVLADVGFLAMDLERLGRPDLGKAFLDAHAEFSGERHPESLTEHYIAARAHVRSKVACLRYEQDPTAGVEPARRLHALALRHLEAGQVPLVLVGGLPGTGKSTLATRLGSERKWTILRSDAIRKERAGLAPSDPAPADFREGLYTPDVTRESYAALLDRARRLLELGEPVIVDASWTAGEFRVDARHLAEQVISPVVELHCEAPLEVIAERIGRRREPTEGVRSDATVDIATRMAERMDDWPEATGVDARRNPHEMLARAEHVLDRALTGHDAPSG